MFSLIEGRCGPSYGCNSGVAAKMKERFLQSHVVEFLSAH